MLIAQTPARVVRRNASLSIQAARAQQAQLLGTEVVVLAAGPYNGPNHKSLGVRGVGERIRVADGAYLQHILQHGFVRLADEEGVPQEEGGGEEAAPSGGGPIGETALTPALLAEAGLAKRDADALLEAGFTTKEAIRRSFGVYGLNELVAVKGIAEAKARKIVQWAGIALPEE